MKKVKNDGIWSLRVIVTILLLLIAIPVIFTQCETSEGLKFGTLQKVSHKKFPCDYYVAEFAFEGGRVEGSDDSKSHSNTQSIEVTKEAYDTLQLYLGDKVIFDYKDVGVVACGISKKLTSLKRK